MKSKEEKAIEIIKAIALLVSEEGKSLKIEHDWGYGTGALTNDSGHHTNIGCSGLAVEKSFECFLNGLHGHLVRGAGLSWHRPE